MTHPHPHRPPPQVQLPVLARPVWVFCDHCGVLYVYTAPCACRRGAEPARDLPQGALVVLVSLACGVVMGGCVGLVWWLWQAGGR